MDFLGPLPLRDQVASKILRAQAQRIGPRPFVACAGKTYSYGAMDAAADRTGAALRILGAGRQTRVGILLSNRIEYLDLWFGLSRIGAVQVPLNTAYRSAQILHVLRRAPVPIVVVEESLADELLAVADDVGELETLVVLGSTAAIRARTRKRVVDYAELIAGGSGAAAPIEVSGADTGAVMNTSGTTGPSKGVRLSHAQQYILGRNVARDLELSERDVYYNFFPLFHNTAQAMITLPVLFTGARMVLTERFSARQFWPEVRSHHCTAFYYIGEILRMLLKSTTAADGAGTSLRIGWGIGAAPQDFLEFQRRHDVVLRSGYGSTEANVCVYLPHDNPDPASVGRALPGYELRIGDADDAPLPPGESGEILVRGSEPCTTMQGYDGDPQATLAAWRDLWFHTGDAGYLDAQGNLYFMGRVRDAIRVRGENVSAFEVEEAIGRVPGVLEVAAIAVPCELGGDDVKVVVVPAPGAELEPQALIAEAQARLPKFAVPRYVEIVAALPKTETNKVRKNVLRETPFTPATWDRSPQQR
ncbi:MAG: AMP-binding protein [Burkholderiales bacterium]|nr:AMP-binding protein [Burkholderiales bacterium]